MIGCGALVLLLVLGLAAFIGWQFVPHRTAIAQRCTTFLGADCTDVEPEVIGRLAEMRLPPGTTVHHSSYQSFQDWHLSARFTIPADRVTEWEGSLQSYPPAGTTKCSGLEGEGIDRRCAGTVDPQDPPLRSYTRVTRPDGSVLVELTAFTT